MTTPQRAMTVPNRRLAAVAGARGFRLIVKPGRGETYGLTIEETYGEVSSALATAVVTLTPQQTGRVVDALFAAVRRSNHQPSVLTFTRKAPIRLTEPDGVRLALILLATQPIAKHERVRALVAGINAMSTEETYYWYSKCIGIDANRARKALRTLLSDN
ncbi:hypothetical protein GTZ89_09455 [Streptomyces sp. SID8382]|uniref:DUF7680 family protein n=1 Tax=Streptomyces malaysiensis TaxID=92644 RepID=UPI000CA264FE|nr:MULTISPECIES: hypothetical protein [unclassified Streptomyces]AUA11237.1 hypothetical protein CFP59_03348 [Streptomyces sp. M56]MYX55937.1 hypothetical protein [Streptomyces sp. SID8382]